MGQCTQMGPVLHWEWPLLVLRVAHLHLQNFCTLAHFCTFAHHLQNFCTASRNTFPLLTEWPLARKVSTDENSRENNQPTASRTWDSLGLTTLLYIANKWITITLIILFVWNKFCLHLAHETHLALTNLFLALHWNEKESEMNAKISNPMSIRNWPLAEQV